MLNFRYKFGLLISRFLLLSGIEKYALRKIDKQNLITSFYFHNPSADLFSYLIKFLVKNNYSFISSDELFEILQKKQKPPKRTICISFDDARKELLQNVIPIINEYKIPITIFVPINSIEIGTFWWTYITSNKHLIKNIATFHKLEYSKKLELISAFQKAVKQRQSMTKEEIIALSKNALITIGGHTMNHFTTANMTETELKYELCESKKILENWTKKTIKHFAYPHGFYNRKETKLLVENNYTLSFTTEAKFIDISKTNNLMYLPRFCCFDSGAKEENILRILGIWQKIFR